MYDTILSSPDAWISSCFVAEEEEEGGAVVAQGWLCWRALMEVEGVGGEGEWGWGSYSTPTQGTGQNVRKRNA